MWGLRVLQAITVLQLGVWMFKLHSSMYAPVLDCASHGFEMSLFRTLSIGMTLVNAMLAILELTQRPNPDNGLMVFPDTRTSVSGRTLVTAYV